MANTCGRSGFEAVKNVLQNDSNERVWEKANFALAVSKEAGAIPALVNAARRCSAGSEGRT